MPITCVVVGVNNNVACKTTRSTRTASIPAHWGRVRVQGARVPCVTRTFASKNYGGQGPGLVNVLSLLSGYSRNLHIVIFNFHTPFHTRTPHCLTRPQAVTRPGTGYVHGCPLTTPNRPSRLTPSDPAIHRQVDRHATTTHPHHTASATRQSLTCSRVSARCGGRHGIC